MTPLAFTDLQSRYRGAAMEFARTRTLARHVVRAGMMGACERGVLARLTLHSSLTHVSLHFFLRFSFSFL